MDYCHSLDILATDKYSHHWRFFNNESFNSINNQTNFNFSLCRWLCLSVACGCDVAIKCGANSNRDGESTGNHCRCPRSSVLWFYRNNITGMIAQFMRFIPMRTKSKTNRIQQCVDEPPIYDTDHSDLNSDFDEAELKRNLLKDVSLTIEYPCKE